MHALWNVMKGKRNFHEKSCEKLQTLAHFLAIYNIIIHFQITSSKTCLFKQHKQPEISNIYISEIKRFYGIRDVPDENFVFLFNHTVNPNSIFSPIAIRD